jgi:peptidoglycan/xylan/chitin deacetylase (PgdA/CDA1 family)
MRRSEILYLMYHEIESPGQSLCQDEPGYVRYVLREQDFRQQIDWLQKEEISGLSVSQALDQNPGKLQHDKRLVITFDDGCASDLTVALPLLQKARFGATFYITLGFLGRPGYLVPDQVRRIAEAGFDVGCHSMTHPYLSDLDEPGLRHEIADAKTQLEKITDRPVYNFSCPGGRWTPQVARIAREAGYRSVATSRIAANGPGDDPFQLARVAIMRHTTFPEFQKLCRGKGLWQLQFRNLVRGASRRILGNSIYDRIRRQALRSSPSAKTPSE